MNAQTPQTPLVTVYLVNHNYGRFLEQAIKSVLAQTFVDFELIIIDDGSVDDSREIIERYAPHEKVITIFQKNKGLNVTNNVAIRAATGKYLMRLDADDFLDENALSVMSGVLDRNSHVGMVFPDYYHTDEAGNILEVVRRHDFGNVELMDQPAHGACTMVRLQCLKEIGGYDESYKCQDGWDLWVRFVEHFQVQNVNLPLFYYRQHGKSLTRGEERILATRQQILQKGSERIDVTLKGVAVIPIRGHITDPHTVALRPLGGRLTMEWTIDAAVNAGNISQVIVTSPDEEILDYVQSRYGPDVFTVRRDWRLALPNTSLNETLDHLFSTLPEARRDFNVVMPMFIECPFRSERHIDMAADAMKLFDVDRVIGVRSETDSFFQHDGNGLKALRSSEQLRLECEELYRQVGGFSLIRRGHFPYRPGAEREKIGHVVLDRAASMYLGSEWDWEMAVIHAKKLDAEMKQSKTTRSSS